MYERVITESNFFLLKSITNDQVSTISIHRQYQAAHASKHSSVCDSILFNYVMWAFHFYKKIVRQNQGTSEFLMTEFNRIRASSAITDDIIFLTTYTTNLNFNSATYNNNNDKRNWNVHIIFVVDNFNKTSKLLDKWDY